MSIVEKVARALCWAEGWNPDLTLGGDGKTFLWHEYVRPARAAIKSMRIPTPEMMKAGCDDNGERAEHIIEFQRTGYDLDAYLEDHPDRPKQEVN